MKLPCATKVIAAATALSGLAAAVKLDVNDPASIRSAASSIARNMLSYYKSNATGADPNYLGTFPYPPYYWWESGAIWAGMVDYRVFTGDTSWQKTTTQALLAQAGPAKDFIMPVQRFDTGNDDQIFWAFAAMSALEGGYPQNPGQNPSWLQLVENTFENVIPRWDTAHCGGGLRWQIYPENQGYSYKNTVSTGSLFQLAARLARYTGNPKYAQWAEKTWKWSQDTGLITKSFDVYDGADISSDCKDINKMQWSYNVALYMSGAASMYSVTGSQQWKDRTNGLVNAAGLFYAPYKNATNVAYEAACEPYMTCNNDQVSFKAYLARWQAKTAVLAPFTVGPIGARLIASAKAAAQSCSGGADGAACGTRWYVGGFDSHTGAGQQLSALETIQSLLAIKAGPPATAPGVDHQQKPKKPAKAKTTPAKPKPTTKLSKAAVIAKQSAKDVDKHSPPSSSQSGQRRSAIRFRA